MPLFILGAANDPEQLWIADTNEGTIKKVDPNEASAEAVAVGVPTIQSLRRNGYSVIRDVDVAVVVDETDAPVSRQFTE